MLVRQIESGHHQLRCLVFARTFLTRVANPQGPLSLFPALTDKVLECCLLEQITRFLLELGSGFTYMGQQVPLVVGEQDLHLDLLFYHVRLRAYVVVELKIMEF